MEREILERIRKIKGIISDVDGVLTHGEIVLDWEGRELKFFNVRDGNGIKLWQLAGYKFAFLSGRYSDPVEKRGKELKVDVVQGSHCKIESGEKIISSWGLSWEEVAYVGDDVVDIPIMMKVGFPVAVYDAVDEVKEYASYITEAEGGKGAVREVIEFILQSRGEWLEIIEKFLQRGKNVQHP